MSFRQNSFDGTFQNYDPQHSSRKQIFESYNQQQQPIYINQYQSQPQYITQPSQIITSNQFQNQSTTRFIPNTRFVSTPVKSQDHSQIAIEKSPGHIKVMSPTRPPSIVPQIIVIQQPWKNACFFCGECDYAQGKKSTWKEEFEQHKSIIENGLYVVNRNEYNVKDMDEESDYPSIYEHNALNKDKKRKYINDYVQPQQNSPLKEKSPFKKRQVGKYTEYLNRDFNYDDQQINSLHLYSVQNDDDDDEPSQILKQSIKSISEKELEDLKQQ